MSLRGNLILVISHLFALRRSFLVRKNLSSVGFYEWHIKNFSVWNVGHLFARWPALASQHVANKIFLDLRPEVFHRGHTGVFDVRYTQLFVLKGHVLLRPNSCIFLLFSRNVRTHALYNNLCALLSCFLPFLFAFCTAAYLRHSAILNRPNKLHAHGFMGVI